jgi:hypothetical protein
MTHPIDDDPHARSVARELRETDEKMSEHDDSLDERTLRILETLDTLKLDARVHSALAVALCHPDGIDAVHRLDISDAQLQREAESAWTRFASQAFGHTAPATTSAHAERQNMRHRTLGIRLMTTVPLRPLVTASVHLSDDTTAPQLLCADVKIDAELRAAMPWLGNHVSLRVDPLSGRMLASVDVSSSRVTGGQLILRVHRSNKVVSVATLVQSEPKTRFAPDSVDTSDSDLMIEFEAVVDK